MKITVCGSTAFYSEMEKARDELLAWGHEVRLPELSLEAPPEFGGGRTVNFGKYVEDHGGIDAFEPGHAIWRMKGAAIRDHYDKIEWSDAILVTNYEKRGVTGYIGGNTLIEIGVAFYLGKPIYVLHPVSSDLSYKHEIYSMRPTQLNGDLNRLLSAKGNVIV